MRAVVQRVKQGRVVVSREVVGEIGRGLLTLLAVGAEDEEGDARALAEKIARLRIFPDRAGKMNRSLLEVGGEMLIVSQFTLFGDCRKGRRPSFTHRLRAARAGRAPLPPLHRRSEPPGRPDRHGALRRDDGGRAHQPRPGHPAARLPGDFLMGLPARDAPFLKERLDGLREAFGPPFLGTDPLGMVHRYRRGEDREAAAFFAAALAFGRVAGIRESLRRLLDRLGERPAERLKEWPAGKKENPLRGIVHRWVGPEALHALAGLLGAAFRNRGSLESLFLEGYAPAAPTLNGALARFRRRLLAMGDGTLPREGTADERALRYLLPDPSGGSACKRLHLFLRWMIRPDDGVDLGLWSGPRTDQLTIPLDTHIARIGRLIGLTDRSSPDRKAAEEITDSLRLLDPADPVRYDFSLSRLGILGHCPRRRDDRLCRGCPLRPLCRHWRRPAGRN